MGMYDSYRNRLGYQGSSESGQIEKSTLDFINKSFANSSTYMNVSVDGVMTDIRLLRGKDAMDKIATFRPNSSVNRGAYITVGNDIWLMETFDPHPYFPSGTLNLCNEKMRWKLPDGTVKSYPCALMSLKRKTDLRRDKLDIVDFQLFMNVQYNVDTASIHQGLRIILGNQAFQIYGIDNVSNVFDGHGFIQYGVDVSTLNPNDDMTNLIADNSVYYQQNEPKGNGGGTIKW